MVCQSTCLRKECSEIKFGSSGNTGREPSATAIMMWVMLWFISASSYPHACLLFRLHVLDAYRLRLWLYQGALRFAAAMHRWQLQVLPIISDAQIARMLGTDCVEDFQDQEFKDVELLAFIAPRCCNPQPKQVHIACLSQREKWRHPYALAGC